MKRTRIFEVVALAILGAFALAAPRTQAQNPGTAPAYLPFQGYLADATGSPLKGAFSMTFSLYKAADGKDLLYKEAVSDVNVQDGYFSVYLGEKTPLDLGLFKNNQFVFVGVLIGGDTAELEPRMQLATTPFAAFAQHAGNASTIGGKDANAFMPAAPGAGSIPWSAVGTPPNGSIPWVAMGTPPNGSIPWSAVSGAPADKDTLGGVSTATCTASNTTLKWNPSTKTWSCAADVGFMAQESALEKDKGDNADTIGHVNACIAAATGLSCSIAAKRVCQIQGFQAGIYVGECLGDCATFRSVICLK